MPRMFTASDRHHLIRLASSMKKGSETRRLILAGLVKAAEASPELRARFPTLDWDKVTPEAVKFLKTDAMKKGLPQKMSPKATPQKKEVKSQERVLLKENRKRQRQIKQRMKEIDASNPTMRSVSGKRLLAEKAQIMGFLERLKAEVVLVKNPPTPKASERAYLKHNDSVDRFLAALVDPKKSYRQVEQALSNLGRASDNVGKSEGLLSALGNGGVASEIQAYYDSKEKGVSDLAETKKVEKKDRKERVEGKKARPPVAPKPAKDALGYWGEMPRGVQGFANVSTQRLNAIAQDLMDAAGYGDSDQGVEQRLQKLDSIGFGGNLTQKERSSLNSLLKKSKPKKALESLARTLETAHTVDRYLQKIKGRRYKWDDWVGRQYITAYVTSALAEVARKDPAVYKALAADLGLKLPSLRTLQKPKFKKPHPRDPPPRPKARRKPRWYVGK